MNDKLFANRMGTTHKSFIREILRVTENPNTITFAGGLPNYVDGGGNNTFRLNFSNSDEEKIEEGIKRLANIIKTL